MNFFVRVFEETTHASQFITVHMSKIKFEISLICLLFFAKFISSLDANDSSLVHYGRDKATEIVNSGDECDQSNLEALKYEELLQMAKKSDYCKQQANEVFKQQHLHSTIRLFFAAEDGIKGSLYIGCESAKEFLSMFGASINQLAVDFIRPSEDDHAIVIVQRRSLN